MLDFKIFHAIVRKDGYAFKVTGTPKTIIDAGANVGFGAVYFASRFPEAQILAIEPEPSNFSRLVEHARPYSNIKCLQGALCSKSKKIKIANPDSKVHSAFRVSDCEDLTSSNVLQGYGVVDLLQKMGWQQIDIFKIDIEGSECELFSENFEPWIDKVQTVAVEVHDNEERQASRALFRALDTLPSSYYLRPLGENLVVSRI